MEVRETRKINMGGIVPKKDFGCEPNVGALRAGYAPGRVRGVGKDFRSFER